MPLDTLSADTGADTSANTSNPLSPEQISQERTQRPPYASSTVADIFDMLRIARQTPDSAEQLSTTSQSDSYERPLGPRRESISRHQRRRRESIEGSFQSLDYLGSSNLRPSESRPRATRGSSSSPSESRQEQSPSQIPPQRESSDPSSTGFLGRLREQLEDHDILNRRSESSRNEAPVQTSRLLAWADAYAIERGEYIIPDNIDTVPLRNHHRHSSMSASPRVLETRPLGYAPTTGRSWFANPTGNPPRQTLGRLENAIILLDAQRIPPHNLPSLTFPLLRQLPSVSKSSWLRPGATFLGVQRFSGEPDRSYSALTRRLRGRDSPSSHQWKVEVIIDQVDYLDMTIAGSMTAYDMPDSRDRQSVTTFWTGEVEILRFSY
jgi:hypothetical protein